MPETVIDPSDEPSGGVLKVVGKTHGALNAIVYPAGSPNDWFFKQFVDQVQLDQYAFENNLTITQEKPE